MEPIYSKSNCVPAYQLLWSLALFPTNRISISDDLQSKLNEALDADGIRILESKVTVNGTLLQLLSTQPQVKPSTIVQRTKGRLQHLLRSEAPINWRRNFRLTTVGSANVEAVENYVETQLDHHKMGAKFSQASLTDFVYKDDDVDLAAPIFSTHGQYFLGMHLVLVHADRWNCANPKFVEKTRIGILGIEKKNVCKISRLSILADHLHATIQFHFDLPPEELAFACMNNVAFCHDNLHMWMNSYYVGTIGSYDLNAIRIADQS